MITLKDNRTKEQFQLSNEESAEEFIEHYERPDRLVRL